MEVISVACGTKKMPSKEYCLSCIRLWDQCPTQGRKRRKQKKEKQAKCSRQQAYSVVIAAQKGDVRVSLEPLKFKISLGNIPLPQKKGNK